MAGSFQEKKIQRLIIGGLAVMMGGLLWAFVFLTGGTYASVGSRRVGEVSVGLVIFCLVVAAIGLIVAMIGVFQGCGIAGVGDAKKAARSIADVYVISCMIYDERMEIVYDTEFCDATELNYVVKVGLRTGETYEFHTHPNVFCMIGEGMRGDIICQGTWLNQFTRRILE